MDKYYVQLSSQSNGIKLLVAVPVLWNDEAEDVDDDALVEYAEGQLFDSFLDLEGYSFDLERCS